MAKGKETLDLFSMCHHNFANLSHTAIVAITCLKFPWWNAPKRQ